MEKSKKDLKKWIILILITLVGYWLINNFHTIGNVFKNLFNIMLPFILGGCLAFILNIPMTFFEDKLCKIKKKTRKQTKTLRLVSLILAILVVALILAFIVTLIIPELVEVVKLLISNIPYYIEQLTMFIGNHIKTNDDVSKIIQEGNIDIEVIKNQITTWIPEVLTSSISLVTSIVAGISTFFISIIFAIYILIDKEKLQVQATRILYAYLGQRRAEKIINIGRISKNTFKKFFTVQCLEATILGTLCTIGLLLFKIPYAIPIGILVGVTSLVPVVGAFIGIIVGAILIVAVNPIKVIAFVLFVLVLQQIEGNFIYPRVVGNSVGLPGMWILFSVTVGGSLAGILGMLLGVPVATIVYTLLKADVNKKLEKS